MGDSSVVTVGRSGVQDAGVTPPISGILDIAVLLDPLINFQLYTNIN